MRPMKSIIRQQAKTWLSQNYPESILNTLRASKHYPENDIWFLTFPSSYFDASREGDLNILLQNKNEPNQFYFLKVPFSFFRENKDKFDVRSSGDEFDLHISSKERNWLTCERSKGVSFRKYEQ
jgi:hypothetical protein